MSLTINTCARGEVLTILLFTVINNCLENI